MWKKVFFPLLALLFVFPTWTFAHTGLKEAKPGINETIQGKVNQIEMTFTTKIEKGSSFSVQDADKKMIPIERISLDGRTMKGSIKDPLPDGKYEVQWKIIGADGHPIQGNYSFQVQNSGVQKPEQQATSVKEAKEPEKSETSQPKQPVNANKQSFSPVYLIVALLVVGALISFWWLFRRKAE